MSDIKKADQEKELSTLLWSFLHQIGHFYISNPTLLQNQESTTSEHVDSLNEPIQSTPEKTPAILMPFVESLADEFDKTLEIIVTTLESIPAKIKADTYTHYHLSKAMCTLFEMHDTIINLHDIARLGRIHSTHEVNKREVPIESFLNETINLFSENTKIRDQKIEVNLHKDLAGKRIFLDDQIVRRILQNIIGTGLKDGIPGKPIFLFCKQEENNYKFDIAVVQPSLSEEAVENIFELFYTANDIKPSYNIIMCVNKIYTNILEGSIEVKNVDQSLVRYTLSIPIQNQPS